MSEAIKETETLPPDESWTLKDGFLAIGAFVVIAALAVGAYFFYESTKPPKVAEGSQAPAFTFPLLSGGQASLDDYRGKVVLINVWNTTCLECKKEMPLMQEKYRAMQGRPFEILAISTDARGATEIEPFIDNLFYADRTKVKLTFPILMDTKNEVGSTYQTVRYPESFIVDANGIVVKIIIGRLTENDFQLIDHLVGAEQPSTKTTTN